MKNSAFDKLSIVVPVYNEAETIERAISRINAVSVGLEKEIIVVDDGSTDGTRDKLVALAKIQADLKVVSHSVNQGKGAALRAGFKFVSGDIVLIQDADLEYDSREYAKLLEPVLDGRADVVFGSRFLGGPHRVLYFWHYVGNSLLTLWSNVLLNLNLTDMETGYKVFTRGVLERLRLRSNRFGFEPEFTVKVAKMKARIYEVPISYSGRTYEEGKKISWTDGVKAIFTLLWYSLLG